MTLILTIQGWFYLATGLWPLIHMKSFESVSGPKTDKWLVKTLGLMIAASGVIFLRYPDEEVTLALACLNALFLGLVDVYYSSKGIIWKTYLVDAVVEFGFLVMYLILSIKKD